MNGVLGKMKGVVEGTDGETEVAEGRPAKKRRKKKSAK